MLVGGVRSTFDEDHAVAFEVNTGTNAGYEGLKNAFGILNENILMNLSDTGVSPAKLAVVLLIAAVLAVDIAVLWLISRNSLAEARTFFKDNFYFKRIKLVYPTPVPKHNTPKEQLKHLFHNIREEGKQKLQKEHEGGSGYGSGYGTAYGLDSSYDGTGASASASAPEYGVEHNKLFGKVFGTSASAPDYGYAEEQDNKLFGKLFSRPAKPSWSPVSGPSGGGGEKGTGGPAPSPSFYPPATSPFLESYATAATEASVRKAKSVAEQAVDSVSKASNHLFGSVLEKLSTATSFESDVTNSAFDLMDIQPRVCREKAVCEAEIQAKESYVFGNIMKLTRAFASGFENYREAQAHGRAGHDCDSLYYACPHSYKSSMFAKYFK